MKVEDLKYFLVLCDYLSFSKAADALYVSRNALMRAISNIEDELNCQLFVRGPRGLLLTSFGLEVKGHVTEIVDAYDKLLHICTEASSARNMVLGVSGTHSDKYALERCVENFNAQNPPYHVKYVSLERNESEPAILEGKIDFYFGTVPPTADGLDYSPVVNQEFVLLMNKSKAITSCSCVDYEKLKDEKLVLTSFSEQPKKILERYMGSKIDSNVVYRTTDLTLIYQMVSSRDVIAVLTQYDADLGATLFPDLIVVPAMPRLSFQMGLIFRKNANMLRSCQKFIDYIKVNYEKEYTRGVL